MRFIHTSDWHLGRLFHGIHLTDDQAHVLEQLVGLVAESKPHAVLVAGDIYDRAVPPPEAVALLDEVLSCITVDLKTPVIMIAGNHDSPDRVGFGARMMAGQGLHVFGSLDATFEQMNSPIFRGRTVQAPRHVVIEDEYGPVNIVPLPYAEPAAVRHVFSMGAPEDPNTKEQRNENAPAGVEVSEIRDHGSAMQAMTNAAHASLPTGRRTVAMAHAFVTGATGSDSERPLSVGGSGSVDAASFQGFNYCALGHLHRPQRAGYDNVRYCGSLLKYSFAESDHKKTVSLVEIDADGRAAVEEIALTPQRDVRVIKGSIEEILAGPAAGESRDDYIMVELTDRGAILDAMSRIRTVYPNCLHIDRSAFLSHSGESAGRPADHRSRTHEELFGDFVKEVTGDDLTEPELDALREVLDSLRQAQREDSAT